MTIENHLADQSVRHLPKFWFSVDDEGRDQIGEGLRRELQYVLQVRHDRQEATWRSEFHASLINKLSDLKIQSVFEFQGLLETSKPRNGDSAKAANAGLSRLISDAQHRGFLRYALDALITLRLATDGKREWDRDVWRLAALGLWAPHKYEQVPTIDFRQIHAGWMRDLAKRWAKSRLTNGLAPATVHRQTRDLEAFAKYLRTRGVELTSPAELNRELLEDYACTLMASGLAPNTLRGRFSGLNSFLHQVRLQGWATGLPWNAAYFPGEHKLPSQTLPRFLPPYVLDQMKQDSNIAQLRTKTERTMIRVILDTGLRVSDLRRLSLDCVYKDFDENWYLRPTNWKMSREFSIPVTDELRQHINRQQVRVKTKYGTACPWLFPREKRNPNGEHPYANGQFKQVLTDWVQRISLHDMKGEAVHVSGHQFRHSVATELLNGGMSLGSVAAYLDHESVSTTAIYAKYLDGTVRKEWEQAQEAIRVNIKGDIIPMPIDKEQATGRWVRNEMTTSRTSLAVAHGWCVLPLRQSCPHANACFTCANFESGPVFLGDIKNLMSRTRKIAKDAEAKGQERLAEMNRNVAGNMQLDGM